MNHYSKGSNAERSLIHKVFDLGFAATRTAGSGSTPLPAPDIVVLGKGLKLALEAKAWNSNYLHIDKGQMNELIHWAEMADAIPIIAWKKNYIEWKFLTPSDFTERGKNFMLSWKKAEKKGKSLETILGIQKSVFNGKNRF